MKAAIWSVRRSTVCKYLYCLSKLQCSQDSECILQASLETTIASHSLAIEEWLLHTPSPLSQNRLKKPVRELALLPSKCKQVKVCQAWGRQVSSPENHLPQWSYLAPFNNVLIYPILSHIQTVGSQFSFIIVPPCIMKLKWKATMSLTSYFSTHPASNISAKRKK